MSVQNIGLETLMSRNLANVNMGSARKHTIPVDFSKLEDGFTGNVVVHYPSQLEKMRIGMLKSSLLGGMEVDVQTNNIAHVTATLDVVIDSKPDWLDINDPRVEYEMLEHIYLQYHEWCDTFRRKSE